MNNEEFDRRMGFILEQQARVSANLDKLQERDAQWEARHEQWEARNEQWNARYKQWEARMETVDKQIAELVGFTGTLRDALLGLTYHAERHDQEIAAINRTLAEQAERGKETDARLNALILIVERHLSGHQ